jgi:hypothetical protein
MAGTVTMWKILLILLGTLAAVTGCKLPFPGPHQGVVTDSDTGKPIMGATVEGEWWCHDNPLPDGPGSFFVRSSTVTDDHGKFRLEKETRRGGLFGASFVLKVSAEEYIPAAILADPSGVRLPASTRDYPFRQTSAVREFPGEIRIKLAPALPVLLDALRSGIPRHQREARDQLRKLLGVDLKYDVEKWEEAVRSGVTKPAGDAKAREASKGTGCACPNAADRSGQPRKIRKKVRKFVNAAEMGEMDTVRDLLDSGMNVNVQNYACRTALMKAAYHGHVELVEFLLSRGADVNAKDDNCRTALIVAASWHNNSQTIGILLAHGADVNARDKDGMTPLMFAAQSGYEDAVKVLLSNGAEVDLKDKDGETARFKAAVVDRREIMELLESAGAK